MTQRYQFTHPRLDIMQGGTRIGTCRSLPAARALARVAGGCDVIDTYTAEVYYSGHDGYDARDSWAAGVCHYAAMLT